MTVTDATLHVNNGYIVKNGHKTCTLYDKQQ